MYLRRTLKVFPAVLPLIRPDTACPTCWRAWLNTRPRSALGYCWHEHLAWRVKESGALVTAQGIDRAEHLAMVWALRRREPQGLNVPAATRASG
jgi:hypothetical protein